MRAAVFDQYGAPITVEQVDDPTPSRDGAVIEVQANGVCRSDWHAWVGHDRSVPLPHVPGHELAGTVVAVGGDVSTVRVGDRVTVPFVLGCGACERCQAGDQQVCDNQYQPGFSGWGAFAEYVALPYADENFVQLPSSMEMTTAAGLGCRFATSFRAIVDQGQVKAGDHVAIWGCGGVGLSAVMIATALGAEVHAIDINDDALALARSVGAAHTYRADDMTTTIKEVRTAAGGGVRISLDALGSETTSVASIRTLDKRGRHVQVGLMVGDDARPVIPMWRLHLNEIELYGAHGMQAWRYPAMLEMVDRGDLDPSLLVTEHVTLSEGAEHLQRMAEFPGAGFVVINNFTQ